MKTSLSILLLSAVMAAATDVNFNLTDFLGTVQTLQRRQAVIEPRSTVKSNSTNVVLSERRFFNTGTNGIFTATNMVDGLYRVSVMGLNNTSVFHVNIPATNGTIRASDFIVTLATGALETEDGQTIDLE